MSNTELPDFLEFDAILIDTSIYERNGLKLDKGLLKALYQFKRSPIDLLLPDVIYNELKDHLKKKLNEINVLGKVVHDFREYNLVEPDVLTVLDILKNNINIDSIVENKLNEFIENTGALEIVCGEFADITKILEDYFSATPPFGKEVKKKNEFPDAITLNAIEEWAKQNNKKVLAIACDNDWKSYCEKSENIEYNDDLATVLAYLNTVNAPYVVLNQIENLIQHEDQKFYTSIANLLKIELNGFTPDQTAESYLYWEPEGACVWFERFEFIEDESRIIEADSHQIVVEVNLRIFIGAEGEFSLSAYDSIDGDYVGITGVVQSIETEFESTVLLSFEGEVTTEQTLDNLELVEVEILNKPLVIDFGTLEPSFEDDDY